MSICARPACSQEFERTCRGPQQYCRQYCQKKHYAEEVNKKSPEVIRVENRRFYDRNQARMQKRMRAYRKALCECGRGPKIQTGGGITECAECAAMPKAQEFLSVKGRPLKETG